MGFGLRVLSRFLGFRALDFQFNAFQCFIGFIVQGLEIFYVYFQGLAHTIQGFIGFIFQRFFGLVVFLRFLRVKCFLVFRIQGLGFICVFQFYVLRIFRSQDLEITVLQAFKIVFRVSFRIYMLYGFLYFRVLGQGLGFRSQKYFMFRVLQ